MKVAVVGLGSMGRRYVRNLQSLGVSVVGVDPIGRGDLTMPCVPQVADLPSVDAVIIATLAERHLEDASHFLGKIPLLIEKPLGLLRDPWPSTAENVWIAYNWRLDPALAQVKRGIGRVRYARFEYGQLLSEWRAGSSVYRHAGLPLECSHEIDMAHWLLGPFISSMKAVSDAEVFEVTGRCERGPFSIRLDWCVPGYRRSVTLGTDAGEVRWTGDRALVEATYLAEVKAFLSAIEGQPTDLATYADGLEVLRFVRGVT